MAYAVAYDTGLGFGSVAGILDIRNVEVLARDPILGDVKLDLDDCYHVIWTESGEVLPYSVPVLSDNVVSEWLHDYGVTELAANRGKAEKDVFVSGYPLAWRRIRKWREELAPDWRTISMIGVFAVATIQVPIEQAHEAYSEYAPMLREMISRDAPPQRRELASLPGLRETGLIDTRLRTFASVIEWAPWLERRLRSSDDYSRAFRDRVAKSNVPDGVGLAKLSFLVSLLGRDAACLDARLVKYYYPDREEALKLIKAWGRKLADGTFSDTVLARYKSEENRVKRTRFYEPTHPMPLARAQWMLWESLGRPPGPEDHRVLWNALGI